MYQKNGQENGNKLMKIKRNKYNKGKKIGYPHVWDDLLFLLLVLLLLNVNEIYYVCVWVGVRRTTRKTIIKYEKKDPWLPMYEYIYL